MTMKSENLTSLIIKLTFGHDLELTKYTRRKFLSLIYFHHFSTVEVAALKQLKKKD